MTQLGLRMREEPTIDGSTRLTLYPGAAGPEVDRLSLPQDGERGGLFEFWRIIRADYKFVLIAMAIGMVLAIAVALVKKPMFTAKSELLIESPNGDFLGTRSLSPVAQDPSEASGLTDVQTQLQVIRSDQLINRVIAKLSAEGKSRPLEIETASPSLFGYSLPQPSQSERAYRIHKLVASHLGVRQVGPTRAVEISFSSPDAGFAAEVCNTLAAEYIAYNGEMRWAQSEQTGNGLSHRLEGVRTQLKESQRKLQEYAEQSGLLFGPPVPGATEQSDISKNRLSALQSELSGAEADRMAAESRYRTAQKASSGSVTEVLNDETLRDLQIKINDLQRQSAELETIYTPQNEKLVRVQAQLTSLRTDFSRRSSEIHERMRNDYNASIRREELLKAAYNGQAGVVTSKDSKAIQYGIYKQQVDSDQKLYESMLEQVSRAGMAAAAGTSNIQVFSGAYAPSRSDSSGVISFSVAGLFFGFLAGSAFVFTRKASNRTFSSPGQSQTQVRLREIGVIPSCSPSMLKSAPAITKSESGLSLRVHLDSAASTSQKAFFSSRDNKVELACFLEKTGVVAESFRMLLASIMFADGTDERPKVIVLTSANAREGKTTVLCNLAIAMSEIHKHVLVIDGDVRRPRVHDVFGVPNIRGLRDVLASPREDQPWEVPVQPTRIRGIDVLPSGTAGSDPEASLFYSPLLTDLMQILRKRYDVILIDTPPCLHLADARVMGRLADAAILVTRTGYTTWDQGRAVAQQFAEDGTRILGTVLNDFKRSIDAYAYPSQ